MFEERPLSEAVEAVRETYAKEAIVLDCDRDFETLPPAQAESLGFVVDSLAPSTYPSSWLPSNAPGQLVNYVSDTFTIGMPEDGSVVWTQQTDPPVVLVKPRIAGSPTPFVEFLLAEAFVELHLDVPEHFLGFFESEYVTLADTIPLAPADTYQIAAALYDGWVGLQTKPVFTDWPTEHPSLGTAWQDAGERLRDRIDGLPRAVARGETDFADATELACAGIKHDLSIPPPFAALDTDAYRDHGPAYAIQWASKMVESLDG